eukprot:g2031.t2
MRMDVIQKEHNLRDALAIAIIKRQKDLEAQIGHWKTRADQAERELQSMKSALVQFRSETDAEFEDSLMKLPTLQMICYSPLDSTTINDSISIPEDLRQHQSSLEVFLRNVHALRTAQLLSSKEDFETWSVSTRKLVLEFTTTSLMKLSPGKLRSAYITHVVEFFRIRFEKHLADPEEISMDLEIIVETAVQAIMDRGEKDLHHTAGMEVLYTMVSLPFAHSTVLKTTTKAFFEIVQKQAQNAGELRERIAVCCY